MSKLDHADLLKFLSKPRFSHEVAEHFGISRRLANLHLKETVRSGEILISEKPVLQMLRRHDGTMRPSAGLVYTFKENPATKIRLQESGQEESTRPMTNIEPPSVNTKITTQRGQISRKGIPRNRLPNCISREKTGLDNTYLTRLKLNANVASELQMSGTRMRLTEKSIADPTTIPRKRQRLINSRQLSPAGKMHLLQTLSKKPLPFMDIHSRLGVSKQTIIGLVKSGFLAEFWGKEGVGIRFKLTRKGKHLLKQLDAAARYEPQVKEKPLIRLKHIGLP
jgi:hypothetical protein